MKIDFVDSTDSDDTLDSAIIHARDWFSLVDPPKSRK